jgi:hypothetical protein
MPLSAALRVLRLSSARYHGWVRGDGVCTLDDRPSCPRSVPQRLTHGEVEAIGDMVQSTEHRHMSIRGLALHAQRVGKVFAHPGTWGKLIRERGWRRPRLRLYPAKPKVGLRTHAPNEAWHIDVTIIKLLDGTKAYVHAVIDNFSRRILAWTVASRLDRRCLVSSCSTSYTAPIPPSPSIRMTRSFPATTDPGARTRSSVVEDMRPTRLDGRMADARARCRSLY